MAEQASTPKILPVTAYMVETLIASFEMAKDGGAGLALGIGSKLVATGTLVSETQNSKNGKLATFASSEVLQTLNLIRLSEASPNAVIATVGATFVKKFATAMMLAGDQSRQAELIGDWADVLGQALALGVSVTEAVGTGGVAIPLAVLNLAALAVAVTRAVEATNAAP